MFTKKYTPENITQLEEYEVFCFGSNYQGNHGGGAAKAAFDLFGAEYGIGKGLTGQCYAFPTVVFPGVEHRLSNASLHREMIDFLKCVKKKPEYTFYLTKVGCGLAGITIDEMKGIFLAHYNPEDYPNLIYPIEFGEFETE